jgi:hypothetical protein
VGFFSVILSTKRRENSVAKFLVPDRGDKVDSGIRLSYRPPGYKGWQAGTTTLYRSQLYVIHCKVCILCIVYNVHPHLGTINLATVSKDGGREGGG